MSKSSNSKEICPVCRRVLGARHAAMGHYRKHVREGKLVGTGYVVRSRLLGPKQVEYYKDYDYSTQFRFPAHPDEKGAWWDRGLRWSSSYIGERGLRSMNQDVEKWLWNHEHPRLRR